MLETMITTNMLYNINIFLIKSSLIFDRLFFQFSK